MDEMFFHAYPYYIGDQPEKGKRLTLELAQGDMPLFREDLPKWRIYACIAMFVFVEYVNDRSRPEAAIIKPFRCDRGMKGYFARRPLAEHKLNL